MKKFIGDDYLISNDVGLALWHNAASLPIVDYHCHISPREIYEDRRFDSMADLWLGGDHYKWRLMRAAGVGEEFITGGAPGREKFRRFAEVLPLAAGNPLYAWCHLELRRYFDYTGTLGADTADRVWDICEDRLKNDPALTPRGLIKKSGVVMIGTTDDPACGLEWHERLAADGSFGTRVCPTFRPDPALEPAKPGFAAYISRLGEAAGVEITSTAELLRALAARMDAFGRAGCRAADHGMWRPVCRAATESEIADIFRRAMAGETPDAVAVEKYQTYLLAFCAAEYARRGWVMQIHFSCVRNPNSRAMRALGPDTGFDSIGRADAAADAYRLFDMLESADALPRTVLYSLDPTDNAWLDTLAGAFQSPGVPGKIQHGSAWWFNDHEDGIREQLAGVAAHGVLGTFIGMLTDSRSFLSYARHEYLRRILCDMLGGMVESGRYPDDRDALMRIVRGVCYENALKYFGLEEGAGK